jgi:hypothetical protein
MFVGADRKSNPPAVQAELVIDARATDGKIARDENPS